MSKHGQLKYLWGSVPAIDILKLVNNEVYVANDFSILFAGMFTLYTLYLGVFLIYLQLLGTSETWYSLSMAWRLSWKHVVVL